MKVKKTRGPENTRQKILEAAVIEFSEKGLKGARIAGIARRARTNYQALYYHFGDKEELYAAALESAITLRGDVDRFNIPVEEIGAVAALSRLIDDIFDAFYQNIRSIGLLADENVHMARHFDQMPAAKQLIHDVLETTARILSIGEREGVLRGGLDPVLVYLSIAGLASSYVSSAPMNGKVFGRKFSSHAEIEIWRRHVKATLLSGYCARSPD
jgi:TetR/AcrR family transcriptional regulator